MYRRSMPILALAVIAATSIWYYSQRTQEQMVPSAEPGIVTHGSVSASLDSSSTNALELEEDRGESELNATQINEAIEVIREIDQSNLEEKNSSWDSGFEKISKLDPQRILRWRPVRVDPKSIIETDNNDRISPRDILKISIFPGETIIVRRNHFRTTPETSSMSWTGSPENGENGTVSIHVVAEQNADDLRAIIHYSSKFQDFHVIPTADSRYYVAVETNRDAKIAID